MGLKRRGVLLMRKLMKKVIVGAVLAGIVQFGVSIPMIEASAIDDSRQQQISQQNTKLVQENNRHYSIMQRDNESVQEWNDRQAKENDGHQAYTVADNLLRDRDTYEMLRHQQVLKGFETLSTLSFNEALAKENQLHDQIVHQIEMDAATLFLTTN
jgi:hypothetical protein